MKAVMIFHNAALDSEVNQAMERAGVRHYSKFPGTFGRGAVSEPHLGSEVWPEINNTTMVVASEAAATALMGEVRQLRKRLGKEGVKAFMWEVQEATE